MSSVDITHGPPAGLVTGEAVAATIPARSPLELFWRRLRGDRVAMVALATIAVLVAVALAAPLVVKLLGAAPPDRQSSAALDEFGTPTGPSGEHLFGVDHLVRDVLSRVIYGLRVSLQVALIATGLAVVVGVAAGLVAGYFRGWIDAFLSRLMDVQLAFPVLLLGIGLGVACSGEEGCAGGLIRPGVAVVVFIIALATWPYIGRIIRGQVLSLREREFVEAARSLGASHGRILVRDLLPNLTAPIIVYSTLVIPTNILFEAALSFLGVGVQPPQPSLGQMISDAVSVFDTAWWFMLFPGLALLITVLAFNLVGDGLHDALNPRAGR
jgi:peptide/nickel transport system permease protein